MREWPARYSNECAQNFTLYPLTREILSISMPFLHRGAQRIYCPFETTFDTRRTKGSDDLNLPCQSLTVNFNWRNVLREKVIPTHTNICIEMNLECTNVYSHLFSRALIMDYRAQGISSQRLRYRNDDVTHVNMPKRSSIHSLTRESICFVCYIAVYV